MSTDFDKQSYWHQRFQDETFFDWLQPSKDFVSIIQPILDTLDPRTARILQVGSGTSDLANHLRARGFTNVINTDFEPLAVHRGRDLEQGAFGDVRMQYRVADATQLSSYSHGGKYDLVLDKSTCDAIACAGDEALLRMARGIKDCLAEGGAWIALSFSDWRFDNGNLPFNVEVLAKIPTPKIRPTDPDYYHWCYLLRTA